VNLFSLELSLSMIVDGCVTIAILISGFILYRGTDYQSPVDSTDRKSPRRSSPEGQDDAADDKRHQVIPGVYQPE
jgi:hypothetical protein